MYLGFGMCWSAAPLPVLNLHLAPSVAKARMLRGAMQEYHLWNRAYLLILIRGSKFLHLLDLESYFILFTFCGQCFYLQKNNLLCLMHYLLYRRVPLTTLLKQKFYYLILTEFASTARQKITKPERSLG